MGTSLNYHSLTLFSIYNNKRSNEQNFIHSLVPTIHSHFDCKFKSIYQTRQKNRTTGKNRRNHVKDKESRGCCVIATLYIYQSSEKLRRSKDEWQLKYFKRLYPKNIAPLPSKSHYEWGVKEAFSKVNRQRISRTRLVIVAVITSIAAIFKSRRKEKMSKRAPQRLM